MKCKGFSASRAGTTLVELMVSVSLFGILSLGLAALQGETSKSTALSRNRGLLAEDIVVFSQALETILGNTTQILTCNCADNCRFRAEAAYTATSDCVDPSSTCTGIDPLFEVVAEDAQDPGVGPYAGCEPNPYPGTDRGCKKRYKLVLSRPTPIDTAGAPTLVVGQPGELRLENSVSGERVATLRGVYYVRCGRQPLDTTLGPDPRLGADKFHLELRVKARMNNANSSVGEIEGWYPPIGGNPADTGFYSGIHREISTAIPFRNLNTYGVQFGKPRLEFREL